MNLAKLNSEVTHGNFELEKFLRDLVLSMSPSFVPGNIYVVFNTSDTAYVQYAKDWDDLYPDGTRVVQTSLASAYSAASSNRHDVILLNAHNAHALTSMLTITKNRLHIWGMGMRDGAMGIGARARVTMGDSTVSGDIGLMQNTGVGNTFRNIKFDSSSTVAASLYCVVEAGEYSIYEGCEIYKSTDLDETGAAELVQNGDSAQFINCYIGSTVNAASGAIIRANVLLTRGIVSGKASRDSIFKNCILARKSGNSANRFVYGANANDAERMLLFEDCIFWNTALASATPAQNVAFGSAQTDGSVLLRNCAAIGAGTAMSTTTGVFVQGAAQDGTNPDQKIGIAVQAA